MIGIFRTNYSLPNSRQGGHPVVTDKLPATVMRSYAAILLLAAVTTGCADVSWRKEGADPAELERDLTQCRQAARLRAGREAWPSGLPSGRAIGVDAHGVPIMAYSYSFENDRFMLEHDLTRSCMRGKGYWLAPVE